MRPSTLIAGITVAFSLAAAAQTALNVTIALPEREFLPGEPIVTNVTITNKSATDTTFFAKTPADGINFTAQLKTDAGQVFNCGYGRGGIVVPKDPSAVPPQSTLSPGRCIQLTCAVDIARCPLSMFEPGRYILEVSIQKAPAAYSRPWDVLTSSTKAIVISAPATEDAAYLRDLEATIRKADPKTLKGGTMESKALQWGEVLHTTRANAEAICLTRHPTSTYAAYVVYACMAGFAKQDPAVVLGVVHDENSYNSNSYPDDTGKSKDGWRWLKGKEAVDWWARWYDIILKSHPDIWFADELRLKRAVDQLALKNYQAAQAELELISKDEKAPMAHKAKEYLGLMKQKGWVKS
jgi:hypothetical protein